MSELLFSKGELTAALRAQLDQVQEAVEFAAPVTIRDSDIEGLIERFTQVGRVEAIKILEGEIYLTQSATKVDVAHRFEYAWDEDGPLLVDAAELTIHVPFDGDPILLHLRPSHSTSNPPRASVTKSEIVLAAAGPPQDAERIQSRLRQELEMLKQYVTWSRADIDSHNASLAVAVRTLIEKRRANLAKLPDLTKDFGYPVRSPSTPPGPARPAAPNKPVSAVPATVNANLLHLFLCHASQDKPNVRELYRHLSALPIDLWLDEKKLLPGQDWEREIRKALRNAQVVLVCLSQMSITKAGFVQKEIKVALDIADEQPEGTIFVIPVRMEDCDVPDRLQKWQWVDFFSEDGVERLISALRHRAQELKIPWPDNNARPNSR